jgi:hypothetical protein
MSKIDQWNVAEFDDDFFGTAINSAWTKVGPGTFAIDATGTYGRAVLTSGATGVFATDLTLVNLGARNFMSHNPIGTWMLKARFKQSSITTNYIFFGMTDKITAEAPIVSAASADTITTTAANACGFMFDTNMATDNWWLVGTANNVDATAQNSGSAPVANQYATFIVTGDINGLVTFWYNGVRVGTTMSGGIGTGITLTPILAITKNSGASSFTLTVDRVYARQARRGDGADN